MTEIDISRAVASICTRLDLDPCDVRRIEINPGHASVVLLRRNEDGRAFVVDDEAATETRSFRVLTNPSAPSLGDRGVRV